jgi:hypothetical protein
MDLDEVLTCGRRNNFSTEALRLFLHKPNSLFKSDEALIPWEKFAFISVEEKTFTLGQCHMYTSVRDGNCKLPLSE